jgi:protein TonB
LHALVLVLALFLHERPLPEEQEAPQSFSVVFQNGGTQQATAPPAQVQAPPQPAQSQAIPPPPPPPPTPQQPEVNLNVPENMLATLPPPPPRPQPPRPRPAMPHHYTMMMSGMSYGNTSPQVPTRPAPPGMNMSLPQNDTQAVMGPTFSVKGDVGADWMSALNKWVNEHAYYPQAAVEQNQQGTAEVEFTVDRQGNVTSLRLLTSSGSPFLDQAWYGLFQGAQLPPFPAGTKADHVTVDYTIYYQLVPP